MKSALRPLACLCLLTLWGAAWAAPAPKTRVLMVQWRGETSAERAFMDELRKALVSVDISIFDAKQDKDRLLEYLHGDFPADARRADYVYTFGTTASESVKRFLPGVRPGRLVHVINIVSDPIAAKLADNLSSAGENRIVGCHFVNLETQLRNAARVVTLRKLGFIFNPREENSNIQLTQMTDLAGRMGFTTVPIRIRPERPDLAEALRQIEDGTIDVDCVYLASDSFLVSNADWVVKQLNAAKIPTIASVEQYMREGALVGTIASYQRLGQLVAKAVARDAKDHRAANGIPVILDPDPEFRINARTADGLGIKLDGKALAGAKLIK